MKRSLWVLAIVLWASAAFAQGIDVHFYFVPKVGTGVKGDPFRPKYVPYLTDALGTGPFDWSMMDYGAEASVLLAAEVTAAQHNILAAQTDVLAIPNPIDDAVSGVALSTIQTKLEGLNIPADWITTANTNRDVLRIGGKMMLILQRYNGLFGTTRLFGGGITLDTRWNQLTAAQKSRLQQVGASFNLDTSGVTAQMTLRQILKVIADQLPSFSMEGQTF